MFNFEEFCQCTKEIEHATSNAYYTVLATCWSDKMSPAKYQRENILILGKQSLAVTLSVLRLSFYIHHKYFLQSLNLWPTPSLVCSNTLPLSRDLSLSLHYLALFPHSSNEYFNPVCPAFLIIELMHFTKSCSHFKWLLLHKIILSYHTSCGGHLPLWSVM